MMVHKRVDVSFHWVGQFAKHKESFRYIGPQCEDYVQAVKLSDAWDDDAVVIDAVVSDIDGSLVESLCFDGIVW